MRLRKPNAQNKLSRSREQSSRTLDDKVQTSDRTLSFCGPFKLCLNWLSVSKSKGFRSDELRSSRRSFIASAAAGTTLLLTKPALAKTVLKLPTISRNVILAAESNKGKWMDDFKPGNQDVHFSCYLLGKSLNTNYLSTRALVHVFDSYNYINGKKFLIPAGHMTVILKLNGKQFFSSKRLMDIVRKEYQRKTGLKPEYPRLAISTKKDHQGSYFRVYAYYVAKPGASIEKNSIAASMVVYPNKPELNYSSLNLII